MELILVYFVISEVGLCHHHLQVAAVEQTIVDLLANDFIERTLLVIIEKLLVRIEGLRLLELMTSFIIVVHASKTHHAHRSSSSPWSTSGVTTACEWICPLLFFFIISDDDVALLVELR